MKQRIIINAALLCLVGLAMHSTANGGGADCGGPVQCGEKTEKIFHTCTTKAGQVIQYEYDCAYVATRNKWVANPSEKSKVGNDTKCGQFEDSCGNPQYCGPGVPVASCSAE